MLGPVVSMLHPIQEVTGSTPTRTKMRYIFSCHVALHEWSMWQTRTRPVTDPDPARS